MLNLVTALEQSALKTPDGASPLLWTTRSAGFGLVSALSSDASSPVPGWCRPTRSVADNPKPSDDRNEEDRRSGRERRLGSLSLTSRSQTLECPNRAGDATKHRMERSIEWLGQAELVAIEAVVNLKETNRNPLPYG